MPGLRGGPDRPQLREHMSGVTPQPLKIVCIVKFNWGLDRSL